MSALEKFSRWLKLKIYQFEATCGAYMFSSAEKVVFYSVLFLLISLTAIAMILYLPEHILFIISRMRFYVHGESAGVVGVSKEAVRTLAAATAEAVSSPSGTAAVREL